MRIWEHPDFARVAFGFREAVRAKDEAAIERARGELQRLVRENGARRVEIAAEETVFAERPRRARRRRLTDEERQPDPAANEPTPVLHAEDLTGRLECAVVGEPFVYRRPSAEGRAKRVTRFLVNAFVRGHGAFGRDRMRVLDVDSTTFHAISTLHDEIDLRTRFVLLIRSGAGAPVVEVGSPIPRDLKPGIAAFRRFDLSDVAERLVASAPANPETQRRAP